MQAVQYLEARILQNTLPASCFLFSLLLRPFHDFVLIFLFMFGCVIWQDFFTRPLEESLKKSKV